jgi:hypothetical protein
MAPKKSKANTRAENQAVDKQAMEKFRINSDKAEATELKARADALKPKATIFIAHECIELLNDGTKVRMEAHLTPGHPSSLIKLSETKEQYSKSHILSQVQDLIYVH